MEGELGSPRIKGLLHVFLQGATTIAGERMECRLVWESRGPISRFPERVNARLVRYASGAEPFSLDDYLRVRTTAAWQYQLRIYLPDELVETARCRSDDPALGQLPEILQKHGASMKSQFDAFAEYVVEAERNGTEQYPLYQWTKAIEDPAKKQKHLKSFSLHMKEGSCTPKTKPTPLRRTFSLSWAAV